MIRKILELHEFVELPVCLMEVVSLPPEGTEELVYLIFNTRSVCGELVFVMSIFHIVGVTFHLFMAMKINVCMSSLESDLFFLRGFDCGVVDLVLLVAEISALPEKIKWSYMSTKQLKCVLWWSRCRIWQSDWP